ncbi:MAG: TIGR04222 domain-containing membrane protein, partial [Gemmata sp.]
MSHVLVPAHADLLARILAFDIDGGEVPLPFAARLAREQGWSRSYAERVIEEYKRYVFLATTAGFKVCPSEDVDAAWHLHLTYTKSYWQRFCGEALGKPLHHEPTKGGPAEGEKHLRMYADTLAAYRAAFGRGAPPDVWPAGESRFGDDTRHRVVNTARNWVVPKAPVKRLAQLGAASVLLALAVPGCDGGPNPFAMKNDEFLFSLGLSLVAAVFVGRLARPAMRAPHPVPEDDARELTWEQAAYLGGESPRLVTATVARLVGRGLAKVGDDGKRLVAAGPLPDDASAVERAVLGALPVTNEGTAMKPVQDAAAAAFAKSAEKLEADGLIIPAARRFKIGLVSLVPLATVLLLFGLPRLLMGLRNNRPVENLTMVMAVGGFLGLTFTLMGSLRLSKRGMALLAKHKERHAGLKTGGQWRAGSEAGMAVALFGTAALADAEFAPLKTWYPRQTGEASSSGCGGGCG